MRCDKAPQVIGLDIYNELNGRGRRVATTAGRPILILVPQAPAWERHCSVKLCFISGIITAKRLRHGDDLTPPSWTLSSSSSKPGGPDWRKASASGTRSIANPTDSLLLCQAYSAHEYKSSWLRHPCGQVILAPCGCHSHSPAGAWRKSAAECGS
jgi:hypothetical protein